MLKSSKIIALILTALMLPVQLITVLAADNDAPKPYIVSFKSDKGKDKIVKKKGKKVKKSYKKQKAAAVELTAADKAELEQDPDVDFIEIDSMAEILSVDKPTKVKNKTQVLPWGLESIGANLTYHKYDGKKIKVAVFDTGISVHSDNAIAGGKSFVDYTTSYYDDNGHGTHVAGTIGALDNKVGVIGIAPRAEIYSVKVLTGTGGGNYSSIIAGLEWAMDNGIQVINMSLGGDAYSQALENAVNAAREAGIIIVAAAGNKGANGDNTMTYPARYDGVVAVGSVDEEYKISDFSSKGEGLSVVAPGSSVLSTIKDGTYGTMSGTSMAAPHVTGAFAALMSKNKKITADEAIDKILNSATPMGDAKIYGKGLLNLAFAVGEVDGAVVEVPYIEPEPEYITPPAPEENIVEPTPEETVENPVQDEVNIMDIDRELNDYKEKLTAYSNLVLEAGNTELAKEISGKLNELLETDKMLHVLPEEIQPPQKYVSAESDAESSETESVEVMADYDARTAEYEAEVNLFYAEKSGEFANLKNAYAQLVSEYQSAIPAPEYPAPDSDGINAAATAIYLNAPVNVNSTTEIVYQFTPSSTAQYTVYTDQYAGTGGSNDTYLELYSDSLLTNKLTYNDDYNVRFSQITYSLTSGVPYYIKLRHYSSGSQIYARIGITTDLTISVNGYSDAVVAANSSLVYKFTPTVTRSYNIFTGLYGGSGSTYDTVLEIYTDSRLNSYVYRSDDYNGTLFSLVNQSFTAGTTYYIKLRRYNMSAAMQARLSITKYFAPATMSANTNYDIKLTSGEAAVYKFTPGASGEHTFFTSWYNGVTSSNYHDTYLELYSDAYATKKLTYNDDGLADRFSQIKYSLTANTTYYILFKGYSFNAVEGRLKVTPPSTGISQTVNQSVTSSQTAWFLFNANNVSAFSGISFRLKYNTAHLDMKDLAAQCGMNATVTGTYGNVQIVSYTPGEVVFKVVNTNITSGAKWSGTVNVFKFLSKITGTTTFTLEQF